MMLTILGIYVIQSDQLLIFTVHDESPKYDIMYFYSTAQFLIRRS